MANEQGYNRHDLRGMIKQIDELKQINESLTKQEILIETDEKYPQTVRVEFVNNDTAFIENFNVGDKIMLTFKVRGYKSKDRFYTSIQGTKLEELQEEPAGHHE